jgi:phenylalanyl-tRNA synthetase beta subunit
MMFQAPDRSLTDEEVNVLFEKVLSHLKTKMEIEIRK